MPEKPPAWLPLHLCTIMFLSQVACGGVSPPLQYIMRQFFCDLSYDGRPFREVDLSRCDVSVAEVHAAQAIGVAVTFSNAACLVNLMITGPMMRRWGARAVIAHNALWLAIYNLAVYLGMRFLPMYATTGLVWQGWLAALGSKPGIILAINQYIVDASHSEQQIYVLGVVKGAMVLGDGLGALAGGLAADYLGVAPLYLLVILLFVAVALLACDLPFVAPLVTVTPKRDVSSVKAVVKTLSGDLGIFIPRSRGARGPRYFGVLALGVGAFLSIAAMSVAYLQLQLLTAFQFDFTTTQNGYLHLGISVCQAGFLTVAFPEIIKYGRKRWAKRWTLRRRPPSTTLDEGGGRVSLLARPEKSEHAQRFDLAFLRASVAGETVVLAAIALIRRVPHLLLAAFLLTIVSATGPAAQGVIVALVSTDLQDYALPGLGIVEAAAGIVSSTVFPQIFAIMAKRGDPSVTFFANSGTAFAGLVALLCVKYSPS